LIEEGDVAREPSGDVAGEARARSRDDRQAHARPEGDRALADPLPDRRDGRRRAVDDDAARGREDRLLDRVTPAPPGDDGARRAEPRVRLAERLR
jgi:hypothetical protein